MVTLNQILSIFGSRAPAASGYTAKDRALIRRTLEIKEVKRQLAYLETLPLEDPALVAQRNKVLKANPAGVRGPNAIGIFGAKGVTRGITPTGQWVAVECKNCNPSYFGGFRQIEANKQAISAYTAQVERRKTDIAENRKYLLNRLTLLGV